MTDVLDQPDIQIIQTVEEITNAFETTAENLVQSFETSAPKGDKGDIGLHGLPGAVGLLIDELLAGNINNSNRIFITTYSYVAGTTRVYVNGLRQRNGIDFEETGDKEITFSEAPTNIGFTDYLSVTYIGG